MKRQGAHIPSKKSDPVIKPKITGGIFLMGMFAGYGWDETLQGFPPGPGPSPVQWGCHLFVDQELGDDATGLRNDLVFKYETIAAAVADAVAGDIIYILNGVFAIPVGGLWGGKRLTIYCEPGVEISGANINTTIVDGCQIRGYGIITDTDNFLIVNPGTVYFEAQTFNLYRFNPQGADSCTIWAWGDINQGSYFQPYLGEYHITMTFQNWNFLKTEAGPNLACIQPLHIAGSSLEFNGTINFLDSAPSGMAVEFIAGFYFSQYEADFVHNGDSHNYMKQNAHSIRAYFNYTAPLVLADKNRKFEFNGDIYKYEAGTVIQNSAGYVKIKGKVYTDSVSALNPIVINSDQGGVNQPGVIEFGPDSVIVMTDTSQAGNYPVILLGDDTSTIIVNGMLMLADDSYRWCDATAAGTEIKIQGGSVRGNPRPEGANVTNLIAAYQYEQDILITF